MRLKGVDSDLFLKISAIGQDRPGVVFKLASIVKDNDGNIVFQRSMKVGTDFAIIIVTAFESSNQTGVESVKRVLSGGALGKDFAVLLRDLPNNEFKPEPALGTPYILDCVGDDRIGIIALITSVLLQYDINIDAMDSQVTHRPLQGTPTFASTFEFTVPVGFDFESFERAIDELQSDTDMRLAIRPK